jgi:hypothetical protein
MLESSTEKVIILLKRLLKSWIFPERFGADSFVLVCSTFIRLRDVRGQSFIVRRLTISQ